MSDDERRGPKMLVATEALRTPELRIGTLGPNITLPRTVRAAALAAGGGGALLGMLVATTILGWSIQTVSYGGVLGGVAGMALISYSPLRGESLGRWLTLKFKTSRRRTTRNGRPVRLAVGICYVDPRFYGPVRIRAGAVSVRPGSVDDRYTPTELNVPTLRPRPGSGLAALPDDDAPRPTEESPLAEFRSSHAAQVRPDVPQLSRFRDAQKADSAPLPDVEAPREVTYNRPTRRRHGRWVQDASELRDLYSDNS